MVKCIKPPSIKVLNHFILCEHVHLDVPIRFKVLSMVDIHGEYIHSAVRCTRGGRQGRGWEQGGCELLKEFSKCQSKQ